VESHKQHGLPHLERIARISGTPNPQLTSLLRRNARRVVRVVGLLVVTAWYVAVHDMHRRVSRAAERERVRRRRVRGWARSLLRLFAFHVEVQGDIPASVASGILVVANHRSPADIIALLYVFGGYIVSRADLARWPVIGAGARSIGTVFVDRSDNASGSTALQAIQRLLTAGQTVIVFPEATIFDGDDVRPFKGGSFGAARRTRAHVLPVGIAYASGSDAVAQEPSFMAHVARVAISGPSRVVVQIGEPIPAASADDTAALSESAHAAVQRLVGEARRSVDASR
jgi:lyso-ornithine lipid O-acyltransferase